MPFEKNQYQMKEKTMFEKVTSQNPEKIADRITGALVDLASAKEDDLKIAVSVIPKDLLKDFLASKRKSKNNIEKMSKI